MFLIVGLYLLIGAVVFAPFVLSSRITRGEEGNGKGPER